MMTIVCESNQSSCWPRSSTYCTDASPAVSSASPNQSIGEVSRLWNDSSRMNAIVMKNAAIPIGRLMKKISGQEKLSTRIPPIVGPIAGPTMTPSPKIAIAWERLSGA